MEIPENIYQFCHRTVLHLYVWHNVNLLDVTYHDLWRRVRHGRTNIRWNIGKHGAYFLVTVSKYGQYLRSYFTVTGHLLIQRSRPVPHSPINIDIVLPVREILLCLDRSFDALGEDYIFKNVRMQTIYPPSLHYFLLRTPRISYSHLPEYTCKSIENEEITLSE